MLDDMERKEKAQNSRGGIQRLKIHLVEFIRN